MHSEAAYRKTDRATEDVAKEALKFKKPIQVYENFLSKGMHRLRNLKQPQNMRYNANKQELIKKGADPNLRKETLADHWLRLIGRLSRNNTYVKGYTQLAGRKPQVFMHGGQMSMLMNNLCDTRCKYPAMLSVDRTFNVGPVFVTNFAFKNTMFYRRGTKDHPVFIGPIMFHIDCDTAAYREFFLHVKHHVMDSAHKFTIISDREKALRKGLKESFPNSIPFLCTQHLKENMIRYLTNHMVPIEDRERWKKAIFGARGIIMTCESVDNFIEKTEEILLELGDEEDTYGIGEYVTEFLQEVLTFVVEPMFEWPHARGNLTTNMSESLNNVLKIKINFTVCDLDTLANQIEERIRAFEERVYMSIFNHGEFELIPHLKENFTMAEDEWDDMIEEERNDHIKSMITAMME